MSRDNNMKGELKVKTERVSEVFFKNLNAVVNMLTSSLISCRNIRKITYGDFQNKVELCGEVFPK